MQINTKRSLTYKIKENDTLLSVSNTLKVDIMELKRINNIESVKKNDIVLLPKAYKNYYVVQPLDTYQNIANQLNISVEQLKKITNDKKLFVGQKIMF